MSARNMIRRLRAVAATTAGLCLLSVGLTGGTSAMGSPGRAAVGPPFGSFSDPTGISVDQSTGNVYVADGGADEEIQVFGPEGGAPIGGGPSSFTGSSTPSGAFKFDAEPTGIAVSNGKVFVPDVANNLVDEFKLNGGLEYEFLCQITGFGTTGVACVKSGSSGGTGFDEPLGVAVDSSGDLYIGDYGSHDIYELNPAGEEIKTFSDPLEGAPQYLAVAANGTIYGQKYRGSEVLELKRSSPTGGLEGVAERVASSATGIAYDQATGHLLVDQGSVVQELDASHKIVATFGLGVLASNLLEGIAIDEATGVVYALSDGQVQRFGPVVQLADVTTGGASVTHAGVTLEGTVNTGGKPTSYHFRYGTSSVSEASTPVVAAPEGDSSVSAMLTGLGSNTTYSYQLVAENGNGVTYGEVHTFFSTVDVEGLRTGAATNVKTTSATLQGSLEPNEFDTHYWFEYGLDETVKLSTAHRDAGSENGAHVVEEEISGLTPNTTYFFRLIGENSIGTSVGSIVTLHTSSVAPQLEGISSISNITRSSVLVHAMVNPENSPTTYHVEYVEVGGYEPGSENPYGVGNVSPAAQAGSEMVGSAVEQLLTGLKPDTTYHYAVVVSSQGGRVVGADDTFTTGLTTPPLSATGGSNAVTQNDATITGTLNTEGLPTTYGFEIGTEPGVYGPPTGLGSVGAGANEAAVSLSLTGLIPGATYHYRIEATNVDGVAYGADETFTTGVFANTFATPPAPLPFVAVPSIAFPTEVKSTVVKKKATKRVKRKTRKKRKTVRGNKKTKRRKK